MSSSSVLQSSLSRASHSSFSARTILGLGLGSGPEGWHTLLVLRADDACAARGGTGAARRASSSGGYLFTAARVKRRRSRTAPSHRRAVAAVGVLKDVGDERLPARNLRPKDGLHEGARRLEPPPLRRRRVPDARSSAYAPCPGRVPDVSRRAAPPPLASSAKPSVRSHRDRPQRVSQRVDQLERLPARVGAGGVPHEGGESKRDDVSALLCVLVRGRHLPHHPRD